MKIEKDLEQNEEKVLLNNILSLVQQLLQNEESEGAEEIQEEGQMQTGYELEPEENVNMAVDEETEEDKGKKNEIEKGLEETTSDAATANDDSEDRIDDPLTDITEETIDEVAKAILKKLNFKKGIEKSVKNNSSSVNKLLAEIVKIQKSILARQEENEKATLNLYKGLGIAEEIEKNYPIKTQEVKKGLNNPQDVEATLQFIAKSLGIKKEEDVNKSESNIDKVRKTLAESNFLQSLVVKR
jgi:hypothetical protein